MTRQVDRKICLCLCICILELHAFAGIHVLVYRLALESQYLRMLDEDFEDGRRILGLRSVRSELYPQSLVVLTT